MSEPPANSFSPLNLFYSYAREDEHLRNELEKRLSLLVRQGVIAGWRHRKIVPGTDWSQDIDRHLSEASVILLLISPDFLASDYIFSVEMGQALDRHNAGQARVIPIILRPVDWEASPFGKLQVLPRDAKPATTWPNRDEAFLDIARGIRLMCEELQTQRIAWRERTASQFNSGVSSRRPLHLYQLYDVFVESGVPKVTFVERDDFELLKLSLARPGRGVVIEGPSGIGKTTAVEKAVEDLVTNGHISRNDTSVRILSARNSDHQRKLQRLQQWHTGIVIVDDFHRLSPKLCEELVDYLKYLADTKPLSKKLVIVGIPRIGQTLVDTSFDVATRIDVFRLGLVKDELILHMIEKGEEALNIEFDRKAEIALAASGSLNVAQFLCFNICQKEQFTETQDQLRLVRCDIDTAVSRVMAVLSRKFSEPIKRFAAIGGQGDSTGLMLLEELAHSEDGFLSLINLKGRKPGLARGIERFIDERLMNKLYSEYPLSAQYLFFDKTLLSIVFDDPQMAFYLKKLRLSSLAREVGKSATLGQRKVFISYSHKDFKWLDRLRVHLKPVEREGIIDLWDDTKIAAGAQWKEAILEALETARVAIILVSADFLASDFISEYELPMLLSRAASGGTTILPVIVSPCLFNDTGLSVFQAINPPHRPLTAMASFEREQTLVNVVEAIRKRLATEEA